MNSPEERRGAIMGGAFLRRVAKMGRRQLDNNRLKRASGLPVARIRTMDPGEEFVGSGGGGGANGRQREGQQRILPVYELKIRSGEASSASLRIAIAQPGEPQIVRCAIPADSWRSFIPGTLSLHKDGRKVGRAEEGGNSISYEFVPWEDDASEASKGQMQTSAQFGSTGGQQQQQQEGRRIIRRRQHKRKAAKRQHRKRKNPPPKPILFHCSASIFPLEAQRRGRLALANSHQRTLKMTPWQGRIPSVTECPPEAEGFCKNAGKCVQLEPDGARYCLCANNFSGRYCERLSAGLIGTMPLSALCLSSAGIFLFLLVILLSVLLTTRSCASKRIRKASKTMKAVTVRLEEKEEESACTPLEDLYDTADGIGHHRRPSPPSSATLSSASPSPSRIPRLYSSPQKKTKLGQGEKGEREEMGENSNGYDNLEKLREEIQRQKAELEERRAASRQGMEATERELRRSPDMVESLPSSNAPSPPKRSGGAYVNLATENLMAQNRH